MALVLTKIHDQNIPEGQIVMVDGISFAILRLEISLQGNPKSLLPYATKSNLEQQLALNEKEQWEARGKGFERYDKQIKDHQDESISRLQAQVREIELERNKIQEKILHSHSYSCERN
jgi:hypothetical protein